MSLNNEQRSKQQLKDIILGALGRFGIVLAVIIFLMILSAFPFRILHIGDIRPAFLLMAVYYWAITRPETLPPVMAFAAGIILDLLCDFPTGMTALTLVAAQWVLRAQLTFMLGQPFRVLWACFALVALASGILQWALFSLFYLRLVPLVPVLGSAFMTVLLFPLFAPLFAKVNKMLEDEGAPL